MVKELIKWKDLLLASWVAIKAVLFFAKDLAPVVAIVFAAYACMQNERFFKYEHRIILTTNLQRNSKIPFQFRLVMKNIGKSPIAPIKGWIRFVHAGAVQAKVVFEQEIKKEMLESQEVSMLNTPAVKMPATISPSDILFCVAFFGLKEQDYLKIFYMHLNNKCHIVHESDKTYYGLSQQQRIAIAPHLRDIEKLGKLNNETESTCYVESTNGGEARDSFFGPEIPSPQDIAEASRRPAESNEPHP